MPTTEHEPSRPSYQELLAAYERARETYERTPSARSLAVLETGLQILVAELHRPGKFQLGQMVMTHDADRVMREAQQVPLEFFLRHRQGDWGQLPPEDVQKNQWSLEHGARLFSRYTTRRDQALYVIREWDRSVTTLLLAEEFWSPWTRSQHRPSPTPLSQINPLNFVLSRWPLLYSER